jgi:hypothetical protein
MKRFTARIVAGMHVNPHANVPRPFPGEWPTRIMWTFRAVRFPYFGVKLRPGIDYERTYVGKPCVASVKQLQDLLKRFPYNNNLVSVSVREFDRENIILYQTANVGNDAEGPYTQVGTLFGAYHPWQVSGYLLEYFLVPNYMKNIGGFRVYSNVPKLKQEYVDKFKLWMAANCNKTLKSKADLLGEAKERKVPKKPQMPWRLRARPRPAAAQDNILNAPGYANLRWPGGGI